MQRRNAFTLIELLVVIAIIAILAAILFPVFAQAKAAAKKTARLSDMKQTGTAFKIYASDYDDVNVRFYWDWIGGSTNRAVHWPQRILPYTKNNEIMIDGSGSPRPFPRNMAVEDNFAAGPNTAGNWHIGGGVSDTAAERPSELLVLVESGVRDWFGNGSLIRAASVINPWDWRDIDAGNGLSERGIRCNQYFPITDRYITQGDPQQPWSIDWRHTGGASFPRIDSSAKFYRMGTLKPENFYVSTIPAYATEDRNTNCLPR